MMNDLFQCVSIRMKWAMLHNLLRVNQIFLQTFITWSFDVWSWFMIHDELGDLLGLVNMTCGLPELMATRFSKDKLWICSKSRFKERFRASKSFGSLLMYSWASSAYKWKQHMVISMPKSLMNKQNKCGLSTDHGCKSLWQACLGVKSG
jgi:hypothetical protein